MSSPLLPAGHKYHAAGIYADMSVDGPVIGTLVVVVDRAKNLPNRKTIGKQNPYCAARLGKQIHKTRTDMRGGQTPRWDQELRYTVHDSVDYTKLKISCFNDDKRTELISEAWLNLEEVVVPGGGKKDMWQTLNYRGKYAGELRLELTYYDTRPKAKESHRRKSDKPKPSPNAAKTARETKDKRRPLPKSPGGTDIPEPLREVKGPRRFTLPRETEEVVPGPPEQIKQDVRSQDHLQQATYRRERQEGLQVPRGRRHTLGAQAEHPTVYTRPSGRAMHPDIQRHEYGPPLPQQPEVDDGVQSYDDEYEDVPRHPRRYSELPDFEEEYNRPLAIPLPPVHRQRHVEAAPPLPVHDASPDPYYDGYGRAPSGHAYQGGADSLPIASRQHQRYDALQFQSPVGQHPALTQREVPSPRNQDYGYPQQSPSPPKFAQPVGNHGHRSLYGPGDYSQPIPTYHAQLPAIPPSCPYPYDDRNDKVSPPPTPPAHRSVQQAYVDAQPPMMLAASPRPKLPPPPPLEVNRLPSVPMERHSRSKSRSPNPYTAGPPPASPYRSSMPGRESRMSISPAPTSPMPGHESRNTILPAPASPMPTRAYRNSIPPTPASPMPRYEPRHSISPAPARTSPLPQQMMSGNDLALSPVPRPRSYGGEEVIPSLPLLNSGYAELPDATSRFAAPAGARSPAFGFAFPNSSVMQQEAYPTQARPPFGPAVRRSPNPRGPPPRNSVSPIPTHAPSVMAPPAAPYPANSYSLPRPPTRGNDKSPASTVMVPITRARRNTTMDSMDSQTMETTRQRELDKSRGKGPIIGNDGRAIDPSEHLPSDTWAPEPERKPARKAANAVVRFKGPYEPPAQPGWTRPHSHLDSRRPVYSSPMPPRPMAQATIRGPDPAPYPHRHSIPYDTPPAISRTAGNTPIYAPTPRVPINAAFYAPSGPPIPTRVPIQASSPSLDDFADFALKTGNRSLRDEIRRLDIEPGRYPIR